jgi:hypothetical protein
MNSELATLFRKTSWCKIAELDKNLDDEFDELFNLKYELKIDKPLCIEYTFDVIESIELMDQSEKRIATELLIESVDRGVHNWIEFSEKLSVDYPMLKLLFISQNYTCSQHIQRMDDESAESYSMRIDAYDSEAFLSFLQKLKLSVFAIYDYQSSFFRSMDPLKIFDIQPENSIYSVVIGTHNTIPRGTFYLENKHENKKLFFHVRQEFEFL